MKTVTCKFCDHDREVFTGTELKSLRKRNGLTLRKTSELIGVSVSFINDCENDRRNCSSKMTVFWRLYELRHMVFK